MILVEDVHKRFYTAHGLSKWILKGVIVTIPPRVSVGMVGRNGAGKSTLLRIIGGIDQPTRGRVERRCRVSWPMGRARGMPAALTGRQNAKFVCRVHGHESDIPERIARVEDFSELGEAFDEPIYTYSSGMKARLQFAISLAFDFDIYIVDESMSAVDSVFRKKADAAFKARADSASLIMVSHSDSMIKQFCTAGIWITDGKAHWFDDVNEALRAYHESLPNA